MAADIFGDEEYGRAMRKEMNKHVVKEHEYYKLKGYAADKEQIFEREVGSGEIFKKVKIDNEAELKVWLLSEEASLMWSDSEDLHVMSNM